MPHEFPVPTVRLIIEDEQGRVLLLKRTSAEYGGWCLPGGKVDYGQEALDAVKNELIEETSLILDHAQFLFYQDSLPQAPGKMHCLNLYFLCRVSGELKLNEESSDLAWAGPDELKKYDIVFRNDEALEAYFASKNKG